MMLSIIIPTYNESENILNLLNTIYDKLKLGSNMEVVVVDDNSPDGTGQLVEEYARSIWPLVALTATAIGSAVHDYEKNSRGEAVNPRNYLKLFISRLNMV